VKIVIAMDSFKESLTAVRACEIVANTIRGIRPYAKIVTRPMGDGGEGTAFALMAAAGGQWIDKTVMGPLPDMQVPAGFVWFQDNAAALVEMASASGLQLLRPEQRNPLRTTTFGTGQMIRAALDHGARRILLAVGGSATVDGGVGAAMALGWRFLDTEQRNIGFGGGELLRIDTIFPPATRINDGTVEVLCDVNNPLCGPQGAAQVYGPQKGATPQMVDILDSALAHLADRVKDQLGYDIRDLPGAGAAGGLAAGAIAFLKARLVSGIDAVMSQSRLREAMANADWVITGEGCFDEQSLRGKVVSGVSRLAKQVGVRVCVLAGQVLLPLEQYRAAGVETALACMEVQMKLEYAIANAENLLGRAARRFTENCLNE
jgi:glycerate 2-kinase